MSNCPKCGHKLSLLDWRQNCPHCGVNLMYFGFEERFYTDAKYAEMGFAKVRVKWARAKTALIGGKLQIARLCLCLLPALSLLIPSGKIDLTAPFFSKVLSFNALGLYSAFSDGTVGLLTSLKGTPFLGSAASALMNAYIGIAAVAVCAVLAVVFSLLCFFNAKVLARLVCASCTAGFACVIAAAVLERRALAAVAALPFAGSSPAAGVLAPIVCCLMFACVFALNFSPARKGFHVEYKEGDLLRCEMARKLKKGEITLADIPQPIYETEEERNEREASIKDILDAQSHKEATTDE